ncbi:hypothetical protein AB0F52_36670 [Amycolatopsis sp. NPDC024027]|uniref:hypothetical protein n=1 Tax=Amycolatopsis sp. NPDC024027 TaxID=3154327 RepID=UPI0033FF8074
MPGQPMLARAALTLAATAATAVFATIGTASASVEVTKLTQAQAASQLSAAGVTHSSSGGCTSRSNSTCTSYEQINQSTVSGVITLKRASGCAVNITGGTETGHASGTYSHWNGYKVDIAHNSCIDAYIKNTFAYAGVRGDGYPQWQAASGNLYCDEGNHWDITYYTCGC